MPDYHFATSEMKWLNKDVMVARPALLYVHDVPIMWLPFIFQDVRRGRRSGILVPRFGLSDLVRPTRSYHRHIANLGYYFVVNDYLDFLVSADWYANRYFATRSQTHYRWLDRFMTGNLAFERFSQLDTPGNSIRLGWNHQQSFSSRTSFNASIDYATSTQVIQTNTVNPYLATAQLGSQASFNKQFDWGTLAIGGTRRQPIGPGPVTQGFPSVTLTPAPVNVTPSITWLPGFSFSNLQTFNNAQPVLAASGAIDTLFSANRQTALSLQTPLRIGRWNWNNSFVVNDVTDNARQEFDIRDSSVVGGVRRVVYYRTFATGIDWQTGINLPAFLTGTWNLQPGVSIVNQTGATPYFRLRNQFTGGQWVQQGKRPQFGVGISPTFFGFFPGFGPIDRIRHSISPIVSYAYAPGSQVSPAFAHAIDPSGQNFRALSDPQQTISVGLSQNFEAKLKPPAGDTTARAARKIRLLGINTSGVSYNFEQAKKPGHTGWQTQTLNNAFASDLLPGFSLSTTHDLWRGQVGTDTAKFDPFLTNVAASFTIRQATLDGIARLLGFGA
ncbi:MAG TPA: putative LPS assembly protein LptD, partial [Candidatus Dormibacteraeota bacterium]|nr:putative LPS assembly protein LptD [Candidatus Dormibacteraeota bacterium]